MTHNLYTENILDHFQNPRNYGPLKVADISAEETNPLCGDKIRIDIKLDKNRKVTEVGFAGEGCAISQASTSILTEYIQGKTLEELWKIENNDIYKLLGISISPARVKCALLGLIALKKALTISKYMTK